MTEQSYICVIRLFCLARMFMYVWKSWNFDDECIPYGIKVEREKKTSYKIAKNLDFTANNRLPTRDRVRESSGGKKPKYHVYCICYALVTTGKKAMYVSKR